MDNINSIGYWIHFVSNVFLITILALAWCSVFWIKSRWRLLGAYVFFVGLYEYILNAYLLPPYVDVAIGGLDTLPYLFATAGRYVFYNLWINLSLTAYMPLYVIWFVGDRIFYFKKKLGR